MLPGSSLFRVQSEGGQQACTGSACRCQLLAAERPARLLCLLCTRGSQGSGQNARSDAGGLGWAGDSAVSPLPGRRASGPYFQQLGWSGPW